MKAPFTHAFPKGGKAPKQKQFSNNQPPFGGKQKQKLPQATLPKTPKKLADLFKEK